MQGEVTDFPLIDFTLIEEYRPTYKAPGTTRRYLTQHAAYVAWAKHIIFRNCYCSPGGADGSPGEQCDIHARLFKEDMGYSWTGEPTEVTIDNTPYMKVRDRLVRWLKWRAKRAKEIKDGQSNHST